MRNLFRFTLLLPIFIPSLTAAASTCRLENMFCESFETLSITGSFDGSSEAKISTVRAYDGKHALHVVGAGGGYNRQFFKVLLSETPFAKRHFGRAMVWLSDKNARGIQSSVFQGAAKRNTVCKASFWACNGVAERQKRAGCRLYPFATGRARNNSIGSAKRV